jgi:hypothetical protein
MGRKPNLDQDRINKLIADIKAFVDLIGIIYINEHKKELKVLKNVEYNETANTVSFNAPYLYELIEQIHEQSIDKKTKKTQASHSYLINAVICKEKNKAAVENIYIIITLIECAGLCTPSISAQTIFNRNLLLSNTLNAMLDEERQSRANGKPLSKHNKQRVINTTFSKTWKLLSSDEITTLKTTYKGISLPNSDMIPYYDNLKDTTYNFKHFGKGKKAASNEAKPASDEAKP